MAKKNKDFEIMFSSKTISKVLHEFLPEVVDAAKEIAANVDVPDDVPVSVTSGTNQKGRPYALVTIAHPSGMARQAKHGTLTKAASEAGIETRRYNI